MQGHVKERAVYTAQYHYSRAAVVLSLEPECHWNSHLVKLICSFMTPTNVPLIHTNIILYHCCTVWHHLFHLQEALHQDLRLTKINRSQKSFVSYYSILAANVIPMGFTVCEIIVKQPRDEVH